MHGDLECQGNAHQACVREHTPPARNGDWLVPFLACGLEPGSGHYRREGVARCLDRVRGAWRGEERARCRGRGPREGPCVAWGRRRGESQAPFQSGARPRATLPLHTPSAALAASPCPHRASSRPPSLPRPPPSSTSQGRRGRRWTRASLAGPLGRPSSSRRAPQTLPRPEASRGAAASRWRASCAACATAASGTTAPAAAGAPSLPRPCARRTDARPARLRRRRSAAPQRRRRRRRRPPLRLAPDGTGVQGLWPLGALIPLISSRLPSQARAGHFITVAASLLVCRGAHACRPNEKRQAGLQ
jgi:hypothetical protein